MFIKTLLLGESGSGKSTAGLSFPGVLQIVFGSTEEYTAVGFKDRSDILPAVKFEWRDCLNDKDKEAVAKIRSAGDELTQDKQIAPIYDKARARAISRFFAYLDNLYDEIKSGKRPEIKTVMIDNWSPLSQELLTYTQMLHSDEVSEKESFKMWEKYYFYCDRVFDALNAMPVNAVVTSHVSMNLPEELASKVSFFDQAKSNVALKKDWECHMVGKYKFRIKGKFDYAFFLYNEEELGKPIQYYAELAGLGKGRINPFEGVGKIKLPKGKFYDFFNDAINKQGAK